MQNVPGLIWAFHISWNFILTHNHKLFSHYSGRLYLVEAGLKITLEMTVLKNSVTGVNCSNHTGRGIVVPYMCMSRMICAKPLNSPAKVHETLWNCIFLRFFYWRQNRNRGCLENWRRNFLATEGMKMFFTKWPNIHKD